MGRPADLLAAVLSAAKIRGETRSAIVREVLAGNQTRFSCFGLARDLSGFVPDPEALSTNPEHMVRYGK